MQERNRHGEGETWSFPAPEIVAACREFERAWRRQERPCIEQCLAWVPAEAHALLLRELVALEMDLRQAAGETVHPRDYLARFPDHAVQVAAAAELHRTRSRSAAVRDASEDVGELARLVDEYLAGLQQGKAPDRAAILAAHPSLADQLEACLASIDLVHGAAGTESLPAHFGRYAVQRTLGRGAFGVVCLARDTELDRLVALKVPTPGRFSSVAELEQFVQEARTTAQLEHPGIVAVYDVLRDAQRVIIVQQYIRGHDLRSRLEQSGPLPPAEATALIIGVAEAVAAAHQKGFVHRDLKPSNILLDELGRPHVADFGLAVHESVPGHRRDRSGTPEYMSPEQVRGETDCLDGRSDIWSLGVVLFELLTGNRPFRGQTIQELFDAILHDDPPLLRQVHAGIPVELERICLKCLSKLAADRYASGTELAQDLRRCLASPQPPAAAQRSDLVRATEYQGGNEEPPQTSMAVLPFVDMSPQQDQDYFCEGMTEELIHRLTRVRRLRVMSRMSVLRFKSATLDIRDVGRQLGVDAVLVGGVRRAGQLLRVTAELTTVSDGYPRWSESYERDVQDVFAVQDDIAQNIVRSLEVILSAGERRVLQAPPTTDVQAYDYYLRGRKFFYQYRRKGIELALQMYSLAITHDAAYAAAYAGMADCYCFLFLYSRQSRAYLEEADAASRKALELAPESPEAHASRGGVLSLYKRHAEAEVEFETAVRLGPDLFDAYYLYARDAFAQGELEKAVALYERASEVNPQDYQSPLLVAQSYEALGRPEQAEAARRRGVALVQQRLMASPDDVRALYMGANALAALGETDKSLEWARLARSMEPDEPMVLYNLACIWSLAGNTGEAIDCLEQAVRNGLTQKGWLEHDGNLDPLRSHPRFQALLVELENFV
ncbi:MAG: protein kinase [Pirellulaceae bacterium]|jgi:TolB-like protein/Flp pilus assembly protein TadD|nr:protein kinase [Pirellulaceae bacterium]